MDEMIECGICDDYYQFDLMKERGAQMLICTRCFEQHQYDDQELDS